MSSQHRPMDDYIHPKSGRIYRQGDPAHTYMLALKGARDAAQMFLHETDALIDADYLTAFDQRNERAGYNLREALFHLLHTEDGIRVDRYRGNEPLDAEWERRYGRVAPENDGRPTDG